MQYAFLKDLLAYMPQSSGVYLFKDSGGNILYIGKAKALKKRVLSYFQKADKDWKVKGLLEEATTIDYIKTNTEVEALLLEAEMVQKYQPKFNVLLRSGQPFLYLRFTDDGLEVVRSKIKKGFYFGPFIYKQQARAVFEFLTKTFCLKLCNKKIQSGCLDYHLNNCAGSCLDVFDKAAYTMRLNLARTVLEQDHKKFLKTIKDGIKSYSEKLEFEKAKNLLLYKNQFEDLVAVIKTKFSVEKYITDVAQATTHHSLVKDATDYYNTAHTLQVLLSLQKAPMTIDCFDISHFQSNSLVGSCVRFNQGVVEKNKLRRFKIKTLHVQNDYAALQECVIRRYKNGLDLPDLILIDGGKGQRNAVFPFVHQTPCVSLAKKEELLFSDIHPEGLPLSLTTTYGKLLIELRDYAHHFAITYHRLLRSKARKGSV